MNRILSWFKSTRPIAKPQTVVPIPQPASIISWDKLLSQGIVDWQLTAIEEFGITEWAGDILSAKREGEDIAFRIQLKRVINRESNRGWTTVRTAFSTIKLRATRLYGGIDGYRFDIPYVGYYVLTPPDNWIPPSTFNG